MTAGPTITEAARPGRAGRWRQAAMEVDSLALTFAAGVTAVLGVGYWMVAAHHYAVADVGRASAQISTATMLATLANLGVGGLYERFLPIAGGRARALLARGGLVTAAAALVAGAGFALLGPAGGLFDTTAQRATFPLLVLVLGQFALLDQALVGLGRARWAAVKNIAHSVAKLLLAMVLALVAGLVAGTAALVLSWVGPALLLCVTYLPVVARRWARDRDPGSLPASREMWSYLGAGYGMQVVSTIAPLVAPLIVLAELGAGFNAYFTVAWTMYTAVALLLATVVGPFVSHAAAAGASVADLVRRFTRLLAALTAAGVVFLGVVAPVVVHVLFGEDYGSASSGLLRLSALVLVPMAVVLWYSGLARVERRLRLAVAAQVLISICQVGGLTAGVRAWGLDGVAVVYLVSELVAAALLLPAGLRAARRLSSGTAHS